MRESAQFYGILVEHSDGWEFVHRSIQDYLAAKFWVESGTFASAESYEWNTRTAYAACISGDSTDVLSGALASTDGVTCAAEILMNAPEFNMSKVAESIMKFYLAPGRVVVMESIQDARIAGRIDIDLFELLSNRFLNDLIERFCRQRSDMIDLLIGYCMAALRQRRQRMDRQTFEIVAKAFTNLNFQFRLGREGFVTPEMARPV